MEITHVIRGEDHLSTRPSTSCCSGRSGATCRAFAHLPLILNPDRTKMSKRKSQTAVSDYIAEGFIREALVNYLALLGWATGTEEEILSIDELIERFDLDRVHKGGAVFDRERLEWLNGQWIRRLEPDDLVERLRPFLAARAWPPAGSTGCPTDDELRPCCRSSASGCRRSAPSATSSASCGSTISRSTRRRSCPSAGMRRRRSRR